MASDLRQRLRNFVRVNACEEMSDDEWIGFADRIIDVAKEEALAEIHDELKEIRDVTAGEIKALRDEIENVRDAYQSHSHAAPEARPEPTPAREMWEVVLKSYSFDRTKLEQESLIGVYPTAEATRVKDLVNSVTSGQYVASMRRPHRS